MQETMIISNVNQEKIVDLLKESFKDFSKRPFLCMGAFVLPLYALSYQYWGKDITLNIVLLSYFLSALMAIFLVLDLSATVIKQENNKIHWGWFIVLIGSLGLMLYTSSYYEIYKLMPEGDILDIVSVAWRALINAFFWKIFLYPLPIMLMFYNKYNEGSAIKQLILIVAPAYFVLFWITHTILFVSCVLK